MIRDNIPVKKDTLENWNKAKNFIPKKDEIIIYIDLGIKVGDGKTKLNELPFVNQNFYSIDGTTLIIDDIKIEGSD